MSVRPVKATGYLVDPIGALPPEHVQQAAQMRRIFKRLIALEAAVETLQDENAKLWKRVKANEAAAPY